MSSSELSELSSSPLTDDDEVPQFIPKSKLEHYFKVGASALPPKLKKKRAPSPPHEYVLADNPDVAFICMFRSRFSEAFSKSLPHYGPQDIERGVIDSPPGEQVERLLCALLGLLLNRKKEVEKGHYSRALEEAVQAHKSQWAGKWEGKNPLHGGGSFNNMTPEQRLTLLRALIMWSLDSSDAVKSIIKDSYKQARHDDDLNQPLSVQPWGRDGDKRRYWLIEGQDDTHFRLYRESNPALKTVTWRSMAGDIDEVTAVAKHLKEEGSQSAVRLHDRIMATIHRFEASEDKRKRRDYRLARRAQFTRPEPGFSLYEGRTRGKRPRYTYSDDEGGDSDAFSARRSTRQSGISTPAEPAGPTFTASGRQVRSRHGGAYGESMLSGQPDGTMDAKPTGVEDADDEDGEPFLRGRSQRAAPKTKPRPGKHIEGYNELDEMDDESDAPSSGNEWDSNAEDEADDQADDDDDEEEDIELSDEDKAIAAEDDSRDESSRRSRSLVVSLRYSKTGSSPLSKSTANGNTTPKEDDILSAPAIYQTDPMSVVKDTSQAIPPAAANEVPASTAHTTIKQLPSTYIPTSYIPSISLVPSLGPINKALESQNQASRPPQPTANLNSPASFPAPPTELFRNPHTYTFEQETLTPEADASEVESPKLNFQQYQYRSPSQ